MTDFNEYAEQLQKEVVSEMAESYFGDRRNLDDLMEDFAARVEELRRRLPALERAAFRLHHLLLGRARSVYVELGVDPACVPFGGGAPTPFFSRLPLALTGAGRYVRCVRKCYDMFQKEVREYLHGRYYSSEGEEGRKRLTVSYLVLREFAARIDAEVVRVNRNRTPTGTLRYVKGMDPVKAEQERLIGDVSYVDGGALDAAMRFAPVEFGRQGLPEIQDIPPVGEVAARLGRLCRTIYAERPDEARAAMRDLVIR